MINKIFSFCFLLFIILDYTESTPHLYRSAHHSYYHHRSPYHVNYSPFNLPKRQYFNVESSIYNDLDENLANEPVKGGIKNTNLKVPNQIKTPMKVFSERKNGYLSSSLSSFQENYSEAKRANPTSSIKQQQQSFNPDSSVIYPIGSDSDDNTAALPVLDTLSDFKKKVESPLSSIKKGSDTKSADTKTKISKPKITLVEPLSSTQATIENPIKIENNIKDETVATSNESNLAIKTSQLDNKSTVSSTTEQPATTLTDSNLSPSSSNSKTGNADSNLEIKEIKIDSIAISEADVVKLESLNESPAKIDSLKIDSIKIDLDVTSAKPEIEAVKIDAIVIKPEEISKPENVLLPDKQETPVVAAKPEESKLAESVPKVDSSLTSSSQTISESKPIIMANPIVSSNSESSLIDVRKNLDNVEKPIIDIVNNIVNSTAVAAEQTVPSKTESDLSNLLINQIKNQSIKSSVDIPPSSTSNTESSLILESGTDTPMIN